CARVRAVIIMFFDYW
nr:immunoglobulin heavy chain junction region [Macaca mulatta]